MPTRFQRKTLAALERVRFPVVDASLSAECQLDQVRDCFLDETPPPYSEILRDLPSAEGVN